MKKTMLIVALMVVLPVGAVAQDTVSTNLGASDVESLDSAGQVALAEKALGEMLGVLDKGEDLLDKARNEDKNIIRLNCVNEKLSAIKGFLKLAETARVSLEAAIAKGDEEEQKHQAKLVYLAWGKVKSEGDEMEGCFGENVQYSGPTNLSIDVDENIRTDNPVDVETQDVDLDPLPEASPYQ